MVNILKKILEPIEELQNIRGIDLPIGLEFLQLVVTGPPGAGKSYYIEQIRGWPNEGYLDLSQKGWWKDRSLIYRPREIHLGIPFCGSKEALTVFDKEWLNSPTPLDTEYSRIKIPPLKNNFLQTDWRNRYIFEFLIPDPSTIFQRRLARQSQGYFPVDENLNLEMVEHQVAIYRQVALYLHRAGLNIYIRESLDSPPMWIAEKGQSTVPPWILAKGPDLPNVMSISGWHQYFRNRTPIQWITLGSKPQSLIIPGRIAHDGRSFELLLGNVHLQFQPEITIGTKKKVAHKNWIINGKRNHSTRCINGFVRIKLGETIVIGTENNEYSELFQFDDSVGQRHVSITNRRGDLVLCPIASDRETKIIRLDDLDYRERLEQGRHTALLDIRRVFGHKIAPLPAGDALQTLKEVNGLLLAEAFRPKNNVGIPGGLIELTRKTSLIIVGDLHGQVDNLLKILSENHILDCLRMQTATLIILGDAVHSENANELHKFETSMLIMDLIFKLKLKFPENIFYIRGNHDSFSPEINKNGVLQGVLFEEALIKHRGHAYTQAMQTFYDRLPYIICSKNFIACHAGPPRLAISRDDIVNIAHNENLALELTTNRPQRPNDLAGYTKGDVNKLRKSLGTSQDTSFIVGHTPMDPFGSFWLDAATIKNHHIIYSAHNEGPGIFVWTGNIFMPINFPAEPLTELTNDLSQYQSLK